MNTFGEVKDRLILLLTDYLGCPVNLAEQTSGEAPFPFVVYSALSSYIPAGGENYIQAKGEQVVTVREEQPSAVFSFTACSMNHEEEGVFIFGEDEAQALAEKAQGWFLHTGYTELSNMGIVAAEVNNVTPRSVFEIDEMARRWGFDVRIRYTRCDSRKEGTVEKVKYGKEKKT